MSSGIEPIPVPTLSNDVVSFITKWSPRVIAVFIGGYYGLGIAYDLGLMAAIDQVAIQVFKNFFGYAGIGAFMPTFQWYSAWGARILIGLITGVLYDLMERIALCIWAQLRLQQPRENQAPQVTTSVSV